MSYSLTIETESLQELDKHIHVHDAYSMLEELRLKLRAHTKHGEEYTVAEFSEFFFQMLNEFEIGHLVS